MNDTLIAFGLGLLCGFGIGLGMAARYIRKGMK